MYHFSSSEVPQSVIDTVQQCNAVHQQPVISIVRNILKYLTGVGGVSKDVLAEEVNNFASTAEIEMSKAQAMTKVLLNILKASFRGGLTSAQVRSDFQSLSVSAEITDSIATLWSEYVHQPDAAREGPKTVAAERETAAAATAEAAPAEPAASLDDVLERGRPRTFHELTDVQWSFGVTAASSEPSRVGRTFVRLGLHLVSPGGQAAARTVQLSVTQFYSLLHQLEKARAVAKFM